MRDHECIEFAKHVFRIIIPPGEAAEMNLGGLLTQFERQWPIERAKMHRDD